MTDNFEVHNPEIELLLKSIGNILKDALPPNFGFMLMVFSYGENGNNFYISSTQRNDMIKVMREWINREVKQ